MNECRGCWSNWTRWESLQLFTKEEIAKARTTFNAKKNSPSKPITSKQPEDSPSPSTIEEQIKVVLNKTPEIIALPNGPSGRTGLIQHEIVLSDNTFI